MADLEWESDKPQKVNPKNIGYLVDAIFGVPIDGERDLPDLTQNENLSIEVSKLFEEILYSLTPRQEKVIRMRYGLQESGKFYTEAEVGLYFALTQNRLREIESKSLRRLRHPSRTKFIEEYLKQLVNRKENNVVPAEQNYVIEKIKKLEPELIRHLKKYENDIYLINPLVFEHLIAEFFASWGFHDVRLVGQNGQTSADIFVAHTINPLGVENRIFVEVKRWRKKVGIEIINQVLGAFFSEKERFGWHSSLIVTIAGFTKFEKWTREELKLKGLELKDKTDLTKWLKDYKECENGLWLPESKKLI
jgi:HJR/Mrr/RecB family endonuclease